MRARCGCNRYFPDPLGSLHGAGRCKRDGEPVPYEGVRYCADVSVEYVGEAFRLPAGSAGGQFVQGAGVIVTSLTRSVRYMVRIDATGTGSPSPTVRVGGAVVGMGKKTPRRVTRRFELETKRWEY